MENRLLYTDRENHAVAVINALRSAGITCYVISERVRVDRGSSTAREDVDWSTIRHVTRHSIIVPDGEELAAAKSARNAEKAKGNMRPQSEMDAGYIAAFAALTGKGTTQSAISTPELRCPSLLRVPATD